MDKGGYSGKGGGKGAGHYGSRGYGARMKRTVRNALDNYESMILKWFRKVLTD